MKSVVPQENAVGLETFFTSSEGIGGKLRTVPEDFRVEELVARSEQSNRGSFTIATVTSKNWETNQLIRVLSKQLHISRKRIHFAGTKDKRSVSTQRFSFYKVPPESLTELSIRDVRISDIYRSDKKVFLGDLRGNRFTICIRNISKKITDESVYNVVDPMLSIGGFPNFFGIQRFGIIRPITHLVGKKMVQNNFEDAVMIYLTFLDEHEDMVSYQARKTLKESMDFKQAFHEFPPTLSFEKAMLNHLQCHPTDFVGAIKELPSNLITMFVYAYQSYLFNKMLSMRIRKGLSIHQAIPGDVICEVQNGMTTDHYFQVSSDNLDRVNRQIQRGKAVVTGVLVGFDSQFSKGAMGEIEHEVFKKESIDKRDFIIPGFPKVSSAGTRRSIFAPVKNVSYQIQDDSLNPDKKEVSMRFDLQKGCYATSFLREIMKAEDIRNY